MKLPILLKTLFFSASPVFADDLLYLKCASSTKVKILSTPDNRLLRETTRRDDLVYRIDLKANTFRASRTTDGPQRFAVLNGYLTSATDYTFNRDSSMRFDLKVGLEPPHLKSLIGKIVDQQNNTIMLYDKKGSMSKG